MQAPPLEQGEELLLQHATQFRNQGGILYITNKRVLWCKHGQPPTISLTYSDIQNQFVSAASSRQILLKLMVLSNTAGYVFDFTGISTVDARDSCKELIAQLLATNRKATAPIKTEPGTPGTPQSSTKPGQQSTPDVAATPKLNALLGSITEEELKQRATLLATNPDLREVHRSLVATGIISESEFWESRKKMLVSDTEKVGAGQEVGMASALLADVRPTSETCNTVHFRLTPAVIHQIFIEFPGVQKAYQKNVPEKMSEKEFWTKYFQSRYFHRDRAIPTATAADDLFADYAEDEKLREAELKRRKLDLDAAVNLGANDDPLDGYGVVVDGAETPNKLSKCANLVRKFNRHGELVLHPPKQYITPGGIPLPPSASTPSTPSTSSTTTITETISDLEETQALAVIPLSIKQHSRYFDSAASAASSIADGEGAWKKWQQQMAAYVPNLERAMVELQLANRVVGEITYTITQSTQASSSSSDIKMPADDFHRELTKAFTTSNELLRHFWCSFPITSPQQGEKVRRLVTAISDLYDKLERLQQGLPPEKRGSLSQMLKPIMEALNAAIVRHRSRTNV